MRETERASMKKADQESRVVGSLQEDVPETAKDICTGACKLLVLLCLDGTVTKPLNTRKKFLAVPVAEVEAAIALSEERQREEFEQLSRTSPSVRTHTEL